MLLKFVSHLLLLVSLNCFGQSTENKIYNIKLDSTGKLTWNVRIDRPEIRAEVQQFHLYYKWKASKELIYKNEEWQLKGAKTVSDSCILSYNSGNNQFRIVLTYPVNSI